MAANDLRLVPTVARPHVWGVLMETGFPQAVVSLVSFGDGTTSMYVSTGGGVIGAGQHAAVRAAANQFLDVLEAHLDLFEPTLEMSLPASGQVRFFVRTFDGNRTAEAGSQELAQGQHPLSVVFMAGHGVITALRLAAEKKA